MLEFEGLPMVANKRNAFVQYLFLAALCVPAMASERINQEGRILGPAPTVTAPTLFNTAAADGIVSAMQIFPLTSAYNEDVSKLPLLNSGGATSAAMIAKIASDLQSSRQTLRLFPEMNYILVPDNQPKVDVFFFNYPDESDDLKPGSTTTGSYPIDANTPVESWPVGTGNLTLSQWQQNINNSGADRHAIMVMPGAGTVWETWLTQFYPAKTPQWQASNGAKFNLNSNALRPAGWTSGDAAGLSMFGPLVRYDECERGMVEHAMRIVVAVSQKGYIYPANHQAGSTTDPNTPAMGQRVRLSAAFQIPANWTKEEKAVALGLKKYGAIVADNGGFFSISYAPDDRFPANCFNNLSTLAISNFEVVQSTDANSGPRAPNPPVVVAGADQIVPLAAGAKLSGSVTGGNTPSIRWYVYPYTTAPGTVTFGNANSAVTPATFSAPGVYTLILSADDGTHAKTFDAVHITVTANGTTGTFASGPTSNATQVVVGTPVQFSVTPGGAGTFTYTWNFGDGMTDTSGASVTHTYAAAGNYTINVTAVDTIGNVLVGSLKLPVVSNTVTPPVIPPLSVSSFIGNIKVKPSGHDTCTFSGIIPSLSSPFTPSGQPLVLNVNGAVVNMTLDKHGRGKANNGSISLILTPLKNPAGSLPPTYPPGSYQGGDIAFKVALKSGNFTSIWSVPSGTVSNVAIPLTIDLTLNGQTYESKISANYSGTAGRGGTLKQ